MCNIISAWGQFGSWLAERDHPLARPSGDVHSQGASEEAEWNEKYAEYKTKHPEEAEEFDLILSGKLPDGWDKVLPTFTPEDKVRLRNHCNPVPLLERQHCAESWSRQAY